MKRFRIKRNLLLTAMIGMLVPLQALAADQDGVTLRQEAGRAAVSVSMTDAKEEDITAVSLTLHIQVKEAAADNTDLVQVEFAFSPALENTEHDVRYQNGKLEIYAASARALFEASGELQLGYVEVTPKDPSDTLSIQIGYEKDSFRTANSSYGSKKPEVTRISPDIEMQVGAGVVYGNSTQALEEYLEQAAQQKQDAYTKEQWERLQEAIRKAKELLQSGSATQDEIDAMASTLYGCLLHPADEGDTGDKEQNTGSDDPVKEGLYDETTRFVSDSSSSKKVSSPVVRNEEKEQKPVDFGQPEVSNPAGVIPGAGLAGADTTGGTTGTSANSAKSQKKVSVISPENGPSGIQISDQGNDNKGSDSLMTEASDLADASEESGQNPDKILFDQENGGLVSDQKEGDEGMPGILIAVVIAVLAAAICMALILKRKKEAVKKKAHQRKKGRKRKH